MADIKRGTLAAKPQAPVVAEGQNKIANNLQGMINSTPIKKRFEEMLGKQSGAFLSSVITLASQSKAIQNADPRTVLAGAAQAASLGFSINPALGECYLVPYNRQVQFQIGYRGIIQLAMRSDKMSKINVQVVHEGELIKADRFNEVFELDEAQKISDNVIGYYAMFELTNGFKKAVYWTRDAVIKHAQKYSKSFGSGPWQTEFDKMACKVVLMSILKTYCPKSIEFQNALVVEEQPLTIQDDGNIETLDVETVDLTVDMGEETNG